MTAYLTTLEHTSTWDSSGSPTPSPSMALRAGSFEVRIARIEVVRKDADWADNNDATTTTISRYASGTISGGSTLSVVPLRQGAPTATATARGGVGAAVSGTGQVPLGAIPALTGGSATYEFAFDCTLSPGAVLYIGTTQSYTSSSPNTGIQTVEQLIVVSFEELRLAWHY